jgi:PncC family amidohydrolase
MKILLICVQMSDGKVAAMTDERLEDRVGAGLRERGLTLATAESCTGGLIGHRLTNVAGSSAYVMGGIIAYSNDAKERLLGVPQAVMLAYGAVSDPTARAMARGARQVFKTDLAVSVTGIAGPGGGSADKPVGLTYIGLATPAGEWCERHVWAGDREAVKAQSAEAALWLVLKFVQGELK